jgi:hypothetical protein
MPTGNASISLERFGPAGTHRGGHVLFVGHLPPHKVIDDFIEAGDPGITLFTAGRPYDGPHSAYRTMSSNRFPCPPDRSARCTS